MCNYTTSKLIEPATYKKTLSQKNRAAFHAACAHTREKQESPPQSSFQRSVANYATECCSTQRPKEMQIAVITALSDSGFINNNFQRFSTHSLIGFSLDDESTASYR
jgi:hypothetical protein